MKEGIWLLQLQPQVETLWCCGKCNGTTKCDVLVMLFKLILFLVRLQLVIDSRSWLMVT